VEVGVVLSGGARVESARFRDELLEQLPPLEPAVIGGEMEAAGAVAASSPEEAGWIVVKGISDFADAASRARIEETRETAARNAARVVLRALLDSGL
jgi:nucleoside phosphorylase